MEVGLYYQCVKYLEHTILPLRVSRPWESLGIDLTGKLPETPRGFMYICTCTEYFTKWVEAFPLRTKDAREVAQSLHRIFYRHGAPESILTDNGKEFVNEVRFFLIDPGTLLGERCLGFRHLSSSTVIKYAKKNHRPLQI